MIKIYGEHGSSEYEAAQQLYDLFLNEHPHLADSVKDIITIIADAKCHGQKVSDIDLVLMASFDPPLTYRPVLTFTNPFRSDQLEKPDSVTIESLCVVIEVKDHSAGGVKFYGTTANVRYGVHWHNVSKQSFDQLHAFRSYLRIKGIDTPYVTNLIWFRNLQNVDLPTRPHNMLAGSFTWNMLFSVIAQVSPPRYSNHQWLLTANQINEQTVENIRKVLTETLVPTQLDRRRMEQINQRTVQAQKLQDIIGKKTLILRGRGGTGKTIHLLQLAKFFYEEEGARVLILTYNKALVSDLRRLLTILGVVDEAAQRSIRVQTVHSFFYAMMRELGIIEVSQEDFLESYNDLKSETLNLFQVGLLLDQDVVELKKNNYSDFLWDYIFIDEAQDWPDDERSILFHFYPYTAFTVADGIDQLIRSAVPANWRLAVAEKERKTSSLQTCLRMKAGLTRFLSTLAGQMGLSPEEWKPNQDVPGGRVIVIEGNSKLYDQVFFTQLIDYNSQAGNEPIDMLFCVPPGLAHGQNIKTPSSLFTEWGFKIWDGTDPLVRETYSTDNEQLRIVQYDSCRGLEGWVVVNFELDSFYEYKLKQLSHPSETSSRTVASELKDPDVIRLRTIRWLLIPLTRAMDTLVIHLTERSSHLKDALKVAATKHNDFVQWIDS